jgi:hypothetical protein
MKYRKKPVVIEAEQWDGHHSIPIIKLGDGVRTEIDRLGNTVLYIKTLEGCMKASVGDYIIRGVNGELYPCKPDIFMKTYEEVVE